MVGRRAALSTLSKMSFLSFLFCSAIGRLWYATQSICNEDLEGCWEGNPLLIAIQLSWLPCMRACLPPCLGGVWPGEFTVSLLPLGERTRIWLLLLLPGVSYYRSSLPSTNVTLTGHNVCIRTVNGILKPAFDVAFDKGFLKVKILTGRLFQHSSPRLGQLYWGMPRLSCTTISPGLGAQGWKASLDIKEKKISQ